MARQVKKHIRKDIQALRAIAVLAVVIYHLWPHRLPGGFMGVDVFFAISGYLMTASLLKAIKPVQDSDHKLSATITYLLEFYARRIKRLVPAASVVLLTTLGVVWLIGDYDIIEQAAKQVIASALFSQNLYLAHESINYLAASTPPTAVQHFWSLSLEEQFYLMWPLALLLLSLVTTHVSILYKKRKIPGITMPILVLIVGSFCYGYFLTYTDPSAAYFITFARIWELLIGGFIVFLPLLRNYDLKLLLSWAGLMMIGYASTQWNGASFPGWHATVPTLGTALVIYAGVGRQKSRLSLNHLLGHRIIQWIGNISYSLYLWHWPLIVLLPLLLMVDSDGRYGFTMKLGILFVSFVLAHLSYRYVELTIHNHVFSKQQIYRLFIALVCFVTFLGLASMFLSRQAANSRLNELHQLVQSDEITCIGGRALLRASCRDMTAKSNTYKYVALGASDDFRIRLDKHETCDTYEPNRTERAPYLRKLCYVGDSDKASARTIAIWGDSHAVHWLNTLDAIGKKTSTRFIIISNGQCSSTLINSPVCSDRLNFVLGSHALQDSDAIIISQLYRNQADLSSQPTEDTINFLKANSPKPIFLLEDIPPATIDGGPYCKPRGKTCMSEREATSRPVKVLSNKLLQKGVLTAKQIIPTSDMFCDQTTCSSIIGGVSVYGSSGDFSQNLPLGNAHISTSYARTLAPYLEAKLRAQGVIP